MPEFIRDNSLLLLADSMLGSLIGSQLKFFDGTNFFRKIWFQRSVLKWNPEYEQKNIETTKQ